MNVLISEVTNPRGMKIILLYRGKLEVQQQQQYWILESCYFSRRLLVNN